MTKKLHWVIGGIILLGVTLIYLSSNASSFEAINNFNETITIYKSTSCGCCGLYGDYFQGRGNAHTKIINIEDVDLIKDENAIPPELRSCHTTMIGDYFVEGHIPLEAVNKLLKEKPDVVGIAMPGMPEGSPGMPGIKTRDFVVYSVNNDGSYQEFMRL